MEEKMIDGQMKWHKVADELAAEKLKLASYDKTLLDMFGNISGKAMLDYGCGPGIMASALQKLGAKITAYDISPDMLEKCSQRIGVQNIYSQIQDIPINHFDAVICNLVMCIVDEAEVANISRNIASVVSDAGKAYIGFCNPLIYDVPESNLDFRRQTGQDYSENHKYTKVKKEGGYEIVELHRPIEWYTKVFEESGLNVVKTHFTPEYELKGHKIQDFVIFELERGL